MLHRFGELLGGQGIEHVFFGEPGAPGLEDAEADFFQVRGMVSVGIDDDFYAMLLGLAEMNVVQVETVRISIEFHSHFVFGGRREHGVHIELVAFAAKLDAARWDVR